jgi:predicted HTH domain antitoxin
MPLTISDDVLQQSGMSEAEARIEIACRLFDAQKLDLWHAAQWAGMSRVAFERELTSRKIPIYRYTVDDIDREVQSLDKLGV